MSLNTRESVNITLEDDRWKDSFDRLLEDRNQLREKNVIKKNVRASFNLDSSFEETFGDNNKNTVKPPCSKKPLKGIKNKENKKDHKTKKTNLIRKEKCKQKNFLKLQTGILTKSQNSTPIKNTEINQPFNCSISPIPGKWTFTYFTHQPSLAKQTLTKNINKMLNGIKSKNNNDCVLDAINNLSKNNKSIDITLNRNLLETKSDSQQICISLTNNDNVDISRNEMETAQTLNKDIADFTEAIIDPIQITNNDVTISEDQSDVFKQITTESVYPPEQNLLQVIKAISPTCNNSLNKEGGNLLVPPSLTTPNISLEVVPSNILDSDAKCKLSSSMRSEEDSNLLCGSTKRSSEQSTNLIKNNIFLSTDIFEKTKNQSYNNSNEINDTVPIKNLESHVMFLNNVTRRKHKQINTFKPLNLDKITEECVVINESFHQPRHSFITKRRNTRLKSNQLRIYDIPPSNLNISRKRATRYKKTLDVIDLTEINNSGQEKSFDNNAKHVSNSLQTSLIGLHQVNQRETLNSIINLCETMGNRNTNYLKYSLNIPAGKWKRTLSLKRREKSSIIQPTFNCDKSIEDSRIKDQTLHPVHRQRTTMYIGGSKSRKYSSFSIKSKNPRKLVLQRCKQTEPIVFSEAYSSKVLQNCKKIGEGAYGEVFINYNKNGNDVVFKVIPIEGDYEVNGEPQKNFEEILSEIVISMELSNLRTDLQYSTSAFVGIVKVQCVKGTYPSQLIDLWELYRDNGHTENDHPEIFKNNQLYVILELENAGKDLEAFVFQNAEQSYSTFLQIACSLAVAEKKFQFEHRDLHWGNILIQMTKESDIVFKLNGVDFKIPSFGAKATIIDYTLSRMSIHEHCLYNDLSKDDELFAAEGDYQFEIYRLMKSKLQNKWEQYEPYTNVLWLHYIIDKMINGVRYRGFRTKKHKLFLKTLTDERSKLLQFSSAYDYVENLKNTKNIFN